MNIELTCYVQSGGVQHSLQGVVIRHRCAHVGLCLCPSDTAHLDVPIPTYSGPCSAWPVPTGLPEPDSDVPSTLGPSLAPQAHVDAFL